MTHDSFARHAFLGEIAFQVEIAEQAATRLPVRGDDFDTAEVWGAIQSILSAAANVSKILWPIRASSTARGSDLRALLGIAEDSVLADRAFRNTCEHYDERLESWLAGRNSAGYVDQLIGSSVGFPNDFTSRVHRAFDYETHTLSYRGDTVDLRELLLALRELRLKCRATVYV